jgi:hypothetical protein
MGKGAPATGNTGHNRLTKETPSAGIPNTGSIGYRRGRFLAMILTHWPCSHG